MTELLAKIETELKTLGVTWEITPLSLSGARPVVDENGWQHFPYHVTISRGIRTINTPFKTGTGVRKPHIADILSSLLSDSDAGGEYFADFCSDLGYEPDSRKALDTYLACQKSGAKLRKLSLPEEIIALLREV